MTMEIHTEDGKVTEIRLDGQLLELGEILSVEQPDSQTVTIISKKTFVVNEVLERPNSVESGP